ncbi:di-heme oxidoreductase family protein [Pseudothauera rhizosphaerae]|uniref:C-type cytochrome n=1 Tax=Pseudothauera rhizosphaerae TaxID=2565932 RepID=A0A4S4AD26_9RHOO|nr:di-heme oxidoredictase family protein [Pseudothauera rhizosphaerae]THF56886.1 c-type cytochrome [Pseudothauera rhizosphaerae]
MRGIRRPGWHWLCLLPWLAAPAAAQDHLVRDASREAYALPFPGLGEYELQRFRAGRGLFRQVWLVAPARDESIDGLGPLYNRLTCIGCHPNNGRGRAPEGPEERLQSMLVRLSVAGRDPHGGPQPHPAYGDQFNEEAIPGVAGEGRAAIEWEYREAVLADGERVELRRPRLAFRELGYGPLGEFRHSLRVGPPVFGVGLLDAVPSATLEALAREPKPDGVRGRVNRVWHVGRGETVAGRFGYKANTADLRQQIAAAMVGDLGITSSLFPAQNCTPAQAACGQAAHGGEPELTDAQLDEMEFYFAHLAVPARRGADEPQVRRGEALFAATGCAACHRPTLKTGVHPRFPRLSEREFAPYTDLLVHDMGEGLADGRLDYEAGGREWRTAPLWGLGLVERVNGHTELLHDGRARNPVEAILWHGGEAQAARDRFARLPRAEREALLAFLRSL